MAIVRRLETRPGTKPPYGARPALVLTGMGALPEQGPPATLSAPAASVQAVPACDAGPWRQWVSARDGYVNTLIVPAGDCPACLCGSPLGKRYGWAIHFDEHGRAALVEPGSARFAELSADPAVIVRAALRSKR